uniref:Putative LOC100202107 [Hydra vulgaris] n=1 Tax=Lepeophtheirus salmonis TaxID=72036 RepID=A0A0K2V1Z5_LEPSM
MNSFQRDKRSIRNEFVSKGQTVNKKYYLGVLRLLHEKIHQKRSELWKSNSWILHDDNIARL